MESRFQKIYLARQCRNIVLVASVTLGLMGCEVTPPETMESTLIPESTRKAYESQMAEAENCALSLNEIADTRQSKLFTVNGHSIAPESVNGWLKSTLKKLHVGSTGSTGGEVNVYLSKIFVNAIGKTLTTNVVLDVQYRQTPSDNFTELQSFRGQSVTVYTPDSSNNVEVALKQAMHQAVRRIKTSYVHQCN